MVCTGCCSTLDHILAFLFKKLSSSKGPISPTQRTPFLRILELHPEILQQMLSSIMNIIMFEECRNQWSMSRPLLGLILLNEEVRWHQQATIGTRLCSVCVCCVPTVSTFTALWWVFKCLLYLCSISRISENVWLPCNPLRDRKPWWPASRIWWRALRETCNLEIGTSKSLSCTYLCLMCLAYVHSIVVYLNTESVYCGPRWSHVTCIACHLLYSSVHFFAWR